MRITPFMIYDQLLSGLRKNEEDYANLNTRLATQKNILAPSDDVSGARRSLDYQVSINADDQYRRNVDGATGNLSLTDTVLTSVTDVVSQVKGLISAAGSAGSPDLRAALAEKAGQLRDQLFSLANTRAGGRYLFSGFRTDVQPYAAGTYDYQGDAGVINVPIDHGAVMPVNVPGEDAFSWTPGAPSVKQLANGLNVHYTPGAGTTVNVEIRDAADSAVLDSFSFSNVVQMTDLLSSALGSGDENRIQALADPLDGVQSRVRTTQADVGARLSSLSDQSAFLARSTNNLKDVLSSIQDADTTETAVLLQKTDTVLQALYIASSKVFSQSLLDFLQ